jgi:transposase-like protein
VGARLTQERRQAILDDLRARRLYAMKAIARRHGVSRSTLKRLAEIIREETPALSHFGADTRTDVP